VTVARLRTEGLALGCSADLGREICRIGITAPSDRYKGTARCGKPIRIGYGQSVSESVSEPERVERLQSVPVHHHQAGRVN